MIVMEMWPLCLSNEGSVVSVSESNKRVCPMCVSNKEGVASVSAEPLSD